MNVTVEILKKINKSVASGNLLSYGALARDCGLEDSILEKVAGTLDGPIPSVNAFLRTMEAYTQELNKRIKMLNECYSAIQKLQLENGMIEGADEPPIAW